MKTDELIALLAADAVADGLPDARRRFAVALAASALVTLAAVAALLGLRADLAAAALEPMLWAKVVFALGLLGAALVAVRRLAVPGGVIGRAALGLLAPVAAIWLLACVQLLLAPPAERPAMVLGSTWRTCVPLIALLSLPTLAALLWVLRGLAPTRLSLAGAGAGLVAGALSAAIYALHCPEVAAPFVAIWYLAGIAVPAALGAVLGPRLLRW